MFSESVIEWLQIPDRQYGPLNERLQYGADKVASKYCRIKRTPDYFDGHWQHGWIASYFNVDVLNLFDEKIADKRRELCLVARKDQEELLNNNGYLSRAVGLPIAYTEPSGCKRRPRSLLVMPAHSNEYTKHRWKFDQYADEISLLREVFPDIVICCHKGCVSNGYWIHEFAKRGFPIVIGADAKDYNSLARMRCLMEQFEYVTTNAYGSCIAYAAAFGAKVSIYGTFAEPTLADFSEVLHWHDARFWETNVRLQSEQTTRKELSEFFTYPSNAQDKTDWGLQQIGADNVVSPHELRKCLLWTKPERFKRALSRYFWACELKVAERAPVSLKRLARRVIGKAQREIPR